MAGKTCIVTGATSGIGLAAVRALAGMGARVIMVGRNPAKLQRAAEAVRAQGGEVETARADLSSMTEVRALAATLLDRCSRIDVLVNNAGVFLLRRQVSPDGFEATFAVNHLAPFLLTNLLLARLRESAGARVVVVASAAHHSGRIDFDDLQLERGYGGWRAYARSKLANVMFTFALARRLEGSGVTANCAHPGLVATSLGSGNRIPVKPLYALLRPFIRGPEQGARTIIQLASSPDVAGITGGYFSDERPARASAAAQDVEAQERLWEASAALTGLA